MKEMDCSRGILRDVKGLVVMIYKQLSYYSIPGAVLFFSISCSDNSSPEPVSNTNLISKSWSLQEYSFNGQDSTASLSISNLEQNFNTNGMLFTTYKGPDSLVVSQDCTWSFADNENSVVFQQPVIIGGFAAFMDTLELSEMSIIRLDDGEFRYRSEYAGGTHDFRYQVIQEDYNY